jgi:hypothetical protein
MATDNRARRLMIFGAFAVAAAAAPAVVSTLALPGAGSSDRVEATCLAWYGSKVDGQCISWSNSTGGASGGVPQISVGGPNSGNPGLSTGPLLPGQSINVPLG